MVAVPSAVWYCTVTGWSLSLDSDTVNENVVVPLFPSAALTSAMEIAGVFTSAATLLDTLP